MRKAFRLSMVALVLAFLFTLVSCVPSTPEKAKEKMEKKDYTVQVVEVKDLGSMLGDDSPAGLETMVIATKGDLLNGEFEMLTAMYFKSSKEAKDAYKEAKEETQDDEYTVYVSGKIVYTGTKQAVKDFK